jgi:hypothetical protein
MRFASSEVIDLFIDNHKALKAGSSQKSSACLACQSATSNSFFKRIFSNTGIAANVALFL